MTDSTEDSEIDKLKCLTMLAKIIWIERENIKTKQYSDRDMRAKIREIIEKEAE